MWDCTEKLTELEQKLIKFVFPVSYSQEGISDAELVAIHYSNKVDGIVARFFELENDCEGEELFLFFESEECLGLLSAFNQFIANYLAWLDSMAILLTDKEVYLSPIKIFDFVIGTISSVQYLISTLIPYCDSAINVEPSSDPSSTWTPTLAESARNLKASFLEQQQELLALNSEFVQIKFESLKPDR